MAKFLVGEQVTYICQKGDPSHERLLGATILAIGPNKIWIECPTPKGPVKKLVNARALRKLPRNKAALTPDSQ